jgi:hypothetical protein
VIDHGVYGARHLGRDRGAGFPAQMSVVSVFRDVAFELVPDPLTEVLNPERIANQWPSVEIDAIMPWNYTP